MAKKNILLRKDSLTPLTTEQMDTNFIVCSDFGSTSAFYDLDVSKIQGEGSSYFIDFFEMDKSYLDAVSDIVIPCKIELYLSFEDVYPRSNGYNYVNTFDITINNDHTISISEISGSDFTFDSCSYVFLTPDVCTFRLQLLSGLFSFFKFKVTFGPFENGVFIDDVITPAVV
ncbi:MAG: hypothetical protein PHX13_12250 [Thiovulaceae bacterium]|nr:hypothetical protein [Sulfurimonadaceae bacterium]